MCFPLTNLCVMCDVVRCDTQSIALDMSSNLWFRSLGFGESAAHKEKWRNFKMQMIANDDDARVCVWALPLSLYCAVLCCAVLCVVLFFF